MKANRNARSSLGSELRDVLRPLGLLLWLATSSVGAAAEDFEARIPTHAGGTLWVELGSGSVEIENHDEQSVRVEARVAGWRSGMSTFSVTPEDGGVRIRGASPGLLGDLGSSVRVHVRVPEQYSIDVRTNGGSVNLEELTGTVRVRTTGGRIEVGQIDGSLDLQTSGARIDVQEIRGDVRARTSGAQIEVEEVSGAVDAETSGGRIDVHEVEGAVRARTSGAAVSVRFSGKPDGELHTSGGSVEVYFAAGVGVTIDAQANGGRIELDDEFEFDGLRSHNRLDAELGGGGARLLVRTSGGNIRILED